MAVAADGVARGEEADRTVEVINAEGAGDVVLACEHASNVIPAEFADLGLDEAARSSHIAWDPGALAVAVALSERLDAPLVAQRVSRLVADCNRPPDAKSAVPSRSEVHDVPGNAGLSATERQRRAERYYRPFRDALAGCLDAGRQTCPPALVTVHSFTPVYFGVRRQVEIGVLHDADRRLADRLLPILRAASDFDVRRNVPYGPEDGVTHTLKAQALPRGLLNAMIEIRSDLIQDRRSQQAMAELLSRCILTALGRGTSERGPDFGAKPTHASSAG